MTSPLMQADNAPTKLITDAKARISAARHELNTAKSVDLTELGRVIQDAMVQVSALPRAEAVAFKGAILALHDDLDALGRDIERVREETRGQLKDLATGRKAAAAYGGQSSG